MPNLCLECAGTMADDGSFCLACGWTPPKSKDSVPTPKAFRAACDACMARDRKTPWVTMLKRPDPTDQTTVQVFFLCPDHRRESSWPPTTTPRYRLPAGLYADHYR